MSIDRSLCSEVADSRNRVSADVKQLVAEFAHIPIDEIRETNTFVGDLGFDSLDQVEFTMEVEEHFDISIPDELAEQARTVGDVVDGVQSLLGPRASNA